MNDMMVKGIMVAALGVFAATPAQAYHVCVKVLSAFETPLKGAFYTAQVHWAPGDFRDLLPGIMDCREGVTEIVITRQLLHGRLELKGLHKDCTVELWGGAPPYYSQDCGGIPGGFGFEVGK